MPDLRTEAGVWNSLFMSDFSGDIMARREDPMLLSKDISRGGDIMETPETQ